MNMKTLSLAALLCVTGAVEFHRQTHPDVIPGEYLLMMRRNATSEAHERMALRLNGRKYSIGPTLKIIGASLTESQLASVLTMDEHIELVEHNMLEHAAQMCPDNQTSMVSWGQERTTTIEPSASSQQLFYQHDAHWGTGVYVYVLDTGIRCTHTEFATGRCEFGANFSPNENGDRNGHGTHCAGTVGGVNWGIAKSATLVDVKVLGDSGSGTKERSIAGVEWVVYDHISNRRGPAVISMSLGGSYHAVQNAAMNEAVLAGIPCSVAAGNSNADTCSGSPASAELVIAVGSTAVAALNGRQVDTRSTFSNWGSCNKIWAPGTSITSAGVSSDTAQATMSGTSMACPHVSGALAVALTRNPQATPQQLLQQLQSAALEGVIQNLDAASPNLLLHVNC